ncbi:MAG: peptidase M15 [Phaeodactylibacter sp.]|nr:peptidase M15 [Phaeodactylibacter sp.]
MSYQPKHFTWSEFDSPDAPGSGAEHMDAYLVELLDEARTIAGVPFVITSGYRTAAQNEAVGGVDTSSHTKGLAVDIAAGSSGTRFKIIQACIAVGFTRIGVGRGFVHVDIDETKSKNVLWDYYG